jgi:guanylate kinase
MGIIVALSGPSGVGKNAILEVLLKIHKYLVYVPSFTTRAMRGGEIEGTTYFYINDAEFKCKQQSDEFLESNEHYGNCYGIDRKKFSQALDKGLSPIKDIDVDGALKLKKMFGNKCLSVYLKSPSFEILQERLLGRKSVFEEETALRLARFKYEEELSSQFDLIVVNDVLQHTVNTVSGRISILEETEWKFSRTV